MYNTGFLMNISFSFVIILGALTESIFVNTFLYFLIPTIYIDLIFLNYTNKDILKCPFVEVVYSSCIIFIVVYVFFFCIIFIVVNLINLSECVVVSCDYLL